MNNLQVTIGILICFIVSISFLYQVNEWYNSQENFYYKIFKQINPNLHPAVVIGSSHVNVLNYTFIKAEVLKKAPNYQIINLGRGADTFEKRVHDIDQIISLKPIIVFYGLDYFDFQNLAKASNPIINNEQITHNFKKLPDVQNLYSYFILPDIPGINQINFQNPKLTSLKLSENAINQIVVKTDSNINITQNSTEQIIKSTNNTKQEKSNNALIQADKNEELITQRANELKKLAKIETYEEIKSDAIRWGAGKPLYIDENNPNSLAFKEIVRKFSDAGIKVVIFTTPRHQLWWDGLSQNDKDTFFKIMDKISKNYSITIYYLHDKYFNLNIWADSHHITMLPEGMIYTKDVSNIILSELNK